MLTIYCAQLFKLITEKFPVYLIPGVFGKSTMSTGIASLNFLAMIFCPSRSEWDSLTLLNWTNPPEEEAACSPISSTTPRAVRIAAR